MSLYFVCNTRDEAKQLRDLERKANNLPLPGVGICCNSCGSISASILSTGLTCNSCGEILSTVGWCLQISDIMRQVSTGKYLYMVSCDYTDSNILNQIEKDILSSAYHNMIDVNIDDVEANN
ncbi:MAG: hypothetical protein ACOYO1_05225 [Bacteroidales bacterium]